MPTQQAPNEQEWIDEDYSWLVGCPASDINFKGALERTNAKTIRMAIMHFESQGGNKTALGALRRQLRKVTAQVAEPTADDKAVVATADRQLRTTELELSTHQAEREAQDQLVVDQTEKETAIAQCYKVIGQIQTSNMFANFANVSSFVWLRDVKEKKLYRDIPGIGTWDKFCESVGMSRQKVDLDLQNLATFGENFLLTCQQLSVGYRELRQLRQLTLDGTIAVTIETLTIGEEVIPLDEDHHEDLQLAIERVLQHGNKLAERVEKLERHKDSIVREETKGLRTEKDALVRENQRLKAFDPEAHDHTWCEEQMKAIGADCSQLTISISKFIVDPRLQGDRPAQAQALRYLNEAEMMLADLRQRFELAYTPGE